MKQFHIQPLTRAVSAALAGSALATIAVVPAHAQQSGQAALEEIIVTAQKREQNLQDVPISVQVLGNQQLEQLNLNSFADYIEFLPTVSFQSARPGISQVYMRGIVSGGDGVHSGSMPSIGVYLDEQPVTTINRVLDVHVYDVARIETLSGPQGTYFGASSQAGTLRIITNKPEFGVVEGGVDLGVNAVEEGEVGYSLEGYTNLPIGDRAALRVVGWYLDDPGYIDNVFQEVTFEGVGETIDNSALVEEDFNDSSTIGARAALRVDLNENWTLTPGIMAQQQESNGVFTHDPEDLGDLQHARFYDEYYDNSWYQASLTLEGQIGGMDLVYAGAYLDMEEDTLDDYTHYAQYLDNLYTYLNPLYPTYYQSCYHTDSTTLICTNPSQYILSDEAFQKQSHELRLQSSAENRFRWMVGYFNQRQEHDFDLRWQVPDLDPDITPARINATDPGATPLGTVLLGELVVWQTKQNRVDRDEAFFGEVNYDLTDQLTLTGGIRLYDFENSLFGFNGSLGRCLDANDEPLYPCYDLATNVDDVSEGDGETIKLSAAYSFTDDIMMYATYSEGFRPGGVNRAAVATAPKYDPDYVDNYEIGWKTTLFNQRLRFNGAVYYLDWQDFQFSFLDFDISPLTIIQNVGQAETTGVEFDATFVATDALTLSLSASYNKAELQEPYWRTTADEEAGLPPRAPAGTEMPFVPELQYSAFARYELLNMRWPGYVQAAFSYTGDSWSNLEVDLRQEQAAYSILNLAAGIEQERWSLDLFIDNATDERAELVRYGQGYFDPFDAIIQETEISVNRPRTWGIRYSMRFQ